MTKEDNITSSDFKQKWVDTLAFFDTLVDNGHKLRPLRFLIRHIIDKGYDTKLFPGSSLYDLLITIPTAKNINYDKSLRVSCDQLQNVVIFKYRDTTGLDKNNSDSLAKAFRWTVTCQYTEINDTFDHFLTLLDSWTQINPNVKDFSNYIFKIEDEIHAELEEYDFTSLDKALEELKKRATIPWDEKPNRCPCKSWRNCERKYQIIEYDISTIPWREIQRKEVLSISGKGTEWKNYR